MKRYALPLLVFALLALVVALFTAPHTALLCILPAAVLLGAVIDTGETGSFPSSCEGRIINVSASNGCTLTRADIRAMTPEDYANLGSWEIGMDKYYGNLREARVAGYRERTLQALLMSRISNIKGQLTKTRIPPSESVILPYISRRQRRNINSNYWKVTAGAANPAAGTGSMPKSAWDLTITNSGSPLANNLQDLDKYFLPGKYLFVEYVASTVNYAPMFKIISAATSGGTTKVTVQPNRTDDWWATASTAEKTPWLIGGSGGGAAEAGTIAYLGVNSVSDFESWGGQDVAENTNSIIDFWLQTSRIVHEYTDEYLRALNAALTSTYFKEFRQLPLAEQKRIQQAKYDRDMLNSAFFGQAINENQTTAGYRNLPKVVDPARPDCVLEFKSNALGFRTQLNNCGRVLNHQGSALNLDSLFQTLYLVKRAREADGTSVEVIDIMTDRFTAGLIQDIMLAYYKAKWGLSYTRYYEPNQSLKFENNIELTYNVYQLPPELGGFQLAVFTDSFFDDKLSAMASAIKPVGVAAANRGRALWILDWTDIELGVAGTNSAVRRTNEADALYNYVMRINAKHVTLNSTTWCPIIEDPNRHYMVENFTNANPTLTVSGVDIVGDGVGNV